MTTTTATPSPSAPAQGDPLGAAPTGVALTIHVAPGAPHAVTIDVGAGVTFVHAAAGAIAQVVAATVEAWLTGDLTPAAQAAA